MPTVRLTTVGPKPEDVVVGKDGAVFTGVEDGRIVRVSIDGTTETVADTAGRPLGLEWLEDGRLLVCDAARGLLAISIEDGKVEVLVAAIEGVPLKLCNNPAVAPDGRIYFSESSTRYGIERALVDLIENRPTGRLIRVAADGEPEVLLDRLSFANGVAVSPDGSFALVAESAACRLTRYWLKGARRGASDTFAILPGFPDNIAAGSDGLLWVAMPSVRSPSFDALHRTPFAMRWLLARLAERIVPQPTPCLVMAFTFDGQVVHHFDASNAAFASATGVREHGGAVHLAGIAGDSIARFELSTSCSRPTDPR